ncbi:hypothetical protein EUGRSUZ_C03108 [Eucalyptus grandis]|uniref:Uncharacterized protein n=3 Tax=Eucalyptus grandis TaxID=71139 RepID=A0A059CU42_EUCGR|nr:hypothetical protein EUGRSUZ_C03108 [Eucalyptus grandis]KAK3438492.1 hypothetical protein EUGRSUZ_C03108 [Eucalyptus grandis]
MMELPFVIEFHLGVKKSTEGFEFVSVIKWEKGDVAPDSVTYRGLIADVNDLGFRLKRMWFRFPGEDHDLPLEIESDEQVKRMVQLASEKGSVRLFVEVGIDICLQGAILWASQRDYSVHFLFFLFALFLSLLLSRIFLGKLEFLNFFSGKSGYYLECVLILLGILVDGWFSLGSPSKNAGFV